MATARVTIRAMERDIALIGFGEAGAAFARHGGWAARAGAFDIEAGRAAAMRELGIRACASAGEALDGANTVLSLVTADQALAAAKTCAPLLARGTIWCDMNSVAPQTKRAAAAIIEAAGGRYVDAAILAPVEPARLAVPVLLAGGAADDAAATLSDIGFSRVRAVGAEVGRASAIKMIRSVMVKGIEALTDEMMRAADAAGVTDEVLASLDASERSWGWTERAAYHLERMDRHGLRRAAEMEEAAQTLSALGVDPVMTRGTVRRQNDRGRAGRGAGA